MLDTPLGMLCIYLDDAPVACEINKVKDNKKVYFFVTQAVNIVYDYVADGKIHCFFV